MVRASWIAIAGAVLGACGGDDPAEATSASVSSASGTGGAGGAGGSGGSGAEGGAGATSASSTGGGGEGGGVNPEALFEATVKDELVDTCGVCHQSAGFDVNFLDEPVYSTISSYVSRVSGKPFVLKLAPTSPLLTYPDSDAHSDVGKTWIDFADLRVKVAAWLDAEAARLPVPPPPPPDRVAPFTPNLGLNIVPLEQLGPRFKGATLTFEAAELGDPPSLLQLTKLTIRAAKGSAIRVVHPRFTVQLPGAEITADPADSLSDLDQTFLPETPAPVGSGEVILTAWASGAKLGLDFSLGKIEPLLVDQKGNLVTACKDPALFQQLVEKLAGDGPKFCAGTCHGGANPDANAQMDLSSLIADPIDWSVACAHMRAKIEPGAPEESLILIMTKPGNSTSHPFKFNGNTKRYDTFKTEMTPWILGEL